MFILKKGHQPGVYVPLRALFLVLYTLAFVLNSGDVWCTVISLCMSLRNRQNDHLYNLV